MFVIVMLTSVVSVGQSDVDTPRARLEVRSDDETQVRVRELIYVLRHHRVFQRADEWGGAIRELVEIGPDALPELLRELEKAERHPTLRGLLFAIRAIDDPRSLPNVIGAMGKAERLSKQGSDCGVAFQDELHAFMKKHQNRPSKDDWVSYGRPINEILSTLHRLSRQPLPNLTKPGPHTTWNLEYWQKWWVVEGKAGFEGTPTIVLPIRDQDFVDRDGIRRFGRLFPTGPNQRLSPVVDITLSATIFADAPSCLDLDNGQMDQCLRGVRVKSPEAYGRQRRKWFREHGIDLTVENEHDLHIWQIDNSRWESLNSEVSSHKPLLLGREAHSLVPKDEDGYRPNEIGTFLFVTREGSCGVMRAHPVDSSQKRRRIEYRLWNRTSIDPNAIIEPPPRPKGQWHPRKLVVLERPDVGKECLLNLATGKTDVLDPVTLQPLPRIQELMRSGGVFNNEEIATWSRRRGLNVATHISPLFGDNPYSDLPNEIFVLTILDSRVTQVTREAFGNLSLEEAKDILARTPPSYRVTHVLPTLGRDGPRATYLFETRDGLIGLIVIVNVQEALSGAAFKYELAKQAGE